MDHRTLGFRFKNDWSKDELKEVGEKFSSGFVISANIEIKADQVVLDLWKVEKILRDAEIIVQLDCICRSKKGNCEAPLDVCFMLNDRGKIALENEQLQYLKPRRVDLEDSLEILRRSHEEGLVHMAYTYMGDYEPKVICSCCSCCCRNLSGLIRFGTAKHVLKSDMIAIDNRDLCIDCGNCIDRCHFGARIATEGGTRLDSEKCFGCGLCVSICPVKAIKIESRT